MTTEAKTTELTEKRMQGILSIGERHSEGETNTANGAYIMDLVSPHLDSDKDLARVYCFDEAWQIFTRMIENGIVLSEGWKLGSIAKAYHQIELERLSEFK